MQLVPSDIHRRTGHTGSIGINNLLGRKMEQKSMLPPMLSTRKSIARKQLQSFENELGYALPSAYTAFLYATNGGRPEQDTFQITGFDNNPYGSVQSFFGFDTDSQSHDLSEMYRWFKASVPAKVLAIGCTAGADYICLDMREGTDRVAFWDHRHHWGTGEWREQDLYFVSDSFEEFVTSLRPNPY